MIKLKQMVKQMKKIIFFLISILFSQVITAQNATIYGVVKDSISGVSVAYANVIILDGAGNRTNFGGITDEKGNYKIDKLPYGDYNIKIFCLGYKTNSVTGIKLTSEQKKVKIDIFINVDISMLDEAVIVETRPTIEFKPDKKIVNIDQAAAAGGASVADFLRIVPEIKIDGDNITLKTYMPTILVNGKPAGPTMGDLTQVPASLISSVEIITNPSVRYTPEGLGGIINLKTRKMSDGLNGMIQGSAATNNKYNGAATLNLKTKKWNTFVNIYDRYLGVKETGSLNQRFYSGDFIYQSQKTSPSINRISTRIGTEFEPNNSNFFALFWEYSKRSGTIKNNNKWEESGLSTNRKYSSEQILKLDSRDHQIGFNYIHAFKNQGKLDIDISQTFGYEPTNVNMSFKDDIYTLSYYNENYYDTKQSDININYSAPIFKTWLIETGTSFNWEQTELYDSLSGSFTEYNNIVDMDRLINAYHIALGKSIGKFSIAAGLRGEYVYQAFNPTIQQSNKNKFDFYPRLGLSYQVKNNINFSLNYGRRIARSSILSLTPYAFIDYNFPSQRFIGNPDLEPAYTNSIDLGGYFQWSKLSLSTSASYMITNDDVANVYFSEDSLTYSTWKNIATSQKILFNINLDYYSKLFKIYRPILTARFGQDFYDSPDSTGKNIHKSFFNYHLNLYNIFYLPKDYLLTVDVTYYPRTFMYASTTENKIDISFVARKTFKFNLSVQIAFYNILNSKHIENISGDGFTSQKILNQNTRQINLGLMYKFGKPIKTRTKVELNLNKIEIQ